MSIRTERVARLIQKEVAQLLHTTFADQLASMVTVTGTRVTGDLSTAYIYLSVLASSPEQRRTTFEHVDELRSSIRRELGRSIRHQVRKIPDLRFFLDESLEEVEHLEQILRGIRTGPDDADASPE
jgi:ribosome-binding factor A